MHRHTSWVPTSSGSAGAVSIEAGGFRVSRTAFARGTLAAHHHERACLSVVIEGSFTEYFTVRGFECLVGGVLIKPAGEPHRDEFAGSVQIIVEPDEKKASGLGVARQVFDRITYRRSTTAAAVALRIARELETADAFTALAVEGLTFELLAGALREERTAAKRAPRWLATVRDRIHDEPRMPVLAELAVLADVNPTYLSRAFRRCYGLSIGRYARRVRLEWVARMLSESGQPISAIAFRAGFADQSHLTRAFHAYWGITPQQYRLAARLGAELSSAPYSQG